MVNIGEEMEEKEGKSAPKEVSKVVSGGDGKEGIVNDSPDMCKESHDPILSGRNMVYGTEIIECVR